MTPKPYHLPKNQYPKYLRGYPQLKGVHIGGCIDGTTWDSDLYAHAHHHPLHQRVGWICVCDRQSFNKETMLHEIAHILCGTKSRGHDDVWRKCVARIGGVVEPEYQKRPRIR